MRNKLLSPFIVAWYLLIYMYLSVCNAFTYRERISTSRYVCESFYLYNLNFDRFSRCTMRIEVTRNFWSKNSKEIFQDIHSRCLCCANDDDDVTSRSGRDRCFRRDRTADRDESKFVFHLMHWDSWLLMIIDYWSNVFVKLVHVSTLLLLFISLLAANFDAAKRTAPKKREEKNERVGVLTGGLLPARECANDSDRGNERVPSV